MKTFNKLIAILITTALWVACGESLEDTYADYAGDGKIRYLAKCSDLTATPGWEKIYLKWKNGVDAMVDGIKVEWSANDITCDTILPASDSTCTLENLVDGSYRIDVYTFNDSKKSLLATTYVRPYTKNHEIVLAFSRGIAKSYRVDDKLAFFTDVWSDNIENITLHYTGTDGEKKEFPLTKEVYDKQFNTIEGVDFGEKVEITRQGRVEGCMDLIQFDPIGLTEERVFASDFKIALERRYGITDNTPENQKIFDAFVDSARVLEFDYDMTSLEDILYFPKLEKVVLGKNRYLDKEFNDYLPGRSTLRDEERSIQILDIAADWEGVYVERYAEHYFDEDEPSSIREMGIPDRSILEELTYVLPTEIDTIKSSVRELAGYEDGLKNLLDNDPSTVWLSSNSGSARTYEITIALKEAKQIKGVKIAQAQYAPVSWNVEDFFPTSARVTVSPDEVEWSDLTYVEENVIGTGSGEVTLLPTAEVREIKFIKIRMIDRDSYNVFRLRLGDIVPYY